jgi:hypothetical protein
MPLMIVEMRTYTLKPGQVAIYLKLYEAEGLATQTRILGRLLGNYASETGDVNQVIHMWAYDDLADRQRRRAALFSDPTWLAYIPKVVELIVTQESKILNPARFSPS